VQHTATHCNTLQHTATHCNALQHTATHCDTLQHTATHYNTLRHTATHCNTLQHTATHCNTLQHTATHCTMTRSSHDSLGGKLYAEAPMWNTLYLTATHCNTLQHTAIHHIRQKCSPRVAWRCFLPRRSFWSFGEKNFSVWLIRWWTVCGSPYVKICMSHVCHILGLMCDIHVTCLIRRWTVRGGHMTRAWQDS